MRGRPVVLEEWGVGQKLASSGGITMLFAGPPGTGKTMAAEVIASELGLDLYKIDLSTIVSKYIGETEKNLERIFGEAQSSNAILFFDEADAIFGKRSEVKDAHDRYANIEISYLLQRMEAYDGVTILATNLRANLDEAFTRRLQFAVDFPFPEEEDRLRIWQTLFPPDVPRGDDLDFDLLARRFKLAGGNIRNIIVSAAYLAAADGGRVTMNHLLHGTRRELQKMGRLMNEKDLSLVRATDGRRPARADLIQECTGDWRGSDHRPTADAREALTTPVTRSPEAAGRRSGPRRRGPRRRKSGQTGDRPACSSLPLDPASSSPPSILALQQAAGNRRGVAADPGQADGGRRRRRLRAGGRPRGRVRALDAGAEAEAPAARAAGCSGRRRKKRSRPSRWPRPSPAWCSAPAPRKRKRSRPSPSSSAPAPRKRRRSRPSPWSSAPAPRKRKRSRPSPCVQRAGPEEEEEIQTKPLRPARRP